MSKVWKTLWLEIPVAQYPESSWNALLLSLLRPGFRQIKFLNKDPSACWRAAALPVPLWHLFWWCADPGPQPRAMSAENFWESFNKVFSCDLCAPSQVSSSIVSSNCRVRALHSSFDNYYTVHAGLLKLKLIFFHRRHCLAQKQSNYKITEQSLFHKAKRLRGRRVFFSFRWFLGQLNDIVPYYRKTKLTT